MQSPKTTGANIRILSPTCTDVIVGAAILRWVEATWQSIGQKLSNSARIDTDRHAPSPIAGSRSLVHSASCSRMKMGISALTPLEVGAESG
jgi:hypothetical protein